MNVVARLRRLAGPVVYDLSRVGEIQALLDKKKPPIGNTFAKTLVTTLWERYAEGPLLDQPVFVRNVRARSAKAYLLPEQATATVLSEALDVLAIRPETLRLILDLGAEAYVRLRSADGEDYSNPLRGQHVLFLPYNGAINAGFTSPLVLQAADQLVTGSVERRGPIEKLNTKWEDYEAMDTKFPWSPPDGADNIPFRTARTIASELPGKRFRDLKLKNPFEPMLQLKSMGVAVVVGVHSLQVYLPPSPFRVAS